MKLRLRVQCWLAVLCVVNSCYAMDWGDPLLTTWHVPDKKVTESARDPQAIMMDCDSNRVPATLTLYDAVSSALCHNPDTISAWLTIQQQAAQQGIARSAYFPTLNASLDASRDHSQTKSNYPDVGDVFTETKTRTRADTLSLSWVLFDFGARAAHAENARQLLKAAIENHQAVLMTVFARTAKDFYQAMASKAAIDAAKEIVDATQSSLDAADARVKNGIAPVSDYLQAQTQHAQSVFNLAQAQGNWQTAMGTLAADMGLPPNQTLNLNQESEDGLANIDFVHHIDVLLAEAKLNHPQIAAAQANLAAAQANKLATLADDLPTVTLTASASRTISPSGYVSNVTNPAGTTQDRSIALQLNIPLFTGFSSFYKVRNAIHTEEIQEQALRSTEEQIAQSVWSNYQLFKTQTDNLNNTKIILDSAKKQLHAAQERYAQGVANILELTTAQSTMANALQQRIQALADWQSTRIALAGSLGVLGVWAIK